MFADFFRMAGHKNFSPLWIIILYIFFGLFMLCEVSDEEGEVRLSHRVEKEAQQ